MRTAGTGRRNVACQQGYVYRVWIYIISLKLRGNSEGPQRKAGKDFLTYVYINRHDLRAGDEGPGGGNAEAGDVSLACGVWGRFSLLREQMRKAATNAIGGKPVRARQEPEG